MKVGALIVSSAWIALSFSPKASISSLVSHLGCLAGGVRLVVRLEFQSSSPFDCAAMDVTAHLAAMND